MKCAVCGYRYSELMIDESTECAVVASDDKGPFLYVGRTEHGDRLIACPECSTVKVQSGGKVYE